MEKGEKKKTPSDPYKFAAYWGGADVHLSWHKRRAETMTSNKRSKSNKRKHGFPTSTQTARQSFLWIASLDGVFKNLSPKNLVASEIKAMLQSKSHVF